jgi:hypothetical protein
MKTEEFIANLATLEPSIIVEKYDDGDDFGDQLVNLVMNYDISDVELGDVGFAEEALGDDDTYEIGMFEEKFLIIDRNTGEIRVEEDDDEGTILYSCAENSEKFLDATWEVVQYLSKQLDETIDDATLDHYEEVAMKCARMAGSEEYFPFYVDWLNCYER